MWPREVKEMRETRDGVVHGVREDTQGPTEHTHFRGRESSRRPQKEEGTNRMREAGELHKAARVSWRFLTGLAASFSPPLYAHNSTSSQTSSERINQVTTLPCFKLCISPLP